MAVTLARLQAAGAAEPPPLMEKFVIQGGVPLSGTVVPAGNKNAALPLIACCPAHRRTTSCCTTCRGSATREAMIDLLEALGTRVEWRDDHTVVLCAGDIPSTAVDSSISRAHPRVLPGRRPAAGPLRLRPMPPPGGDVIGRRRLDPHLDAFIALGATVEHGAREIRIDAPDGGLQATDFFMDEPSVMGTENALMAAALTPGTTVMRQRGVRAARAGPRPHARPHGRGDRGHRLQRDDRARRRAPERLRARGLARPHRDRLLHGAGRRDRRRAANQERGRRRPAHDPARVRAPGAAHRARRRRRRRAGRPEARHEPRPRRLPDQGRGRSLAGVPGRPDLDRRRARDAVRRRGPHVREDVREPPGVHGQARRDGGEHHPLRSAPGRHHRRHAGCAARSSSRRTSAPAWRC